MLSLALGCAPGPVDEPAQAPEPPCGTSFAWVEPLELVWVLETDLRSPTVYVEEPVWAPTGTYAARAWFTDSAGDTRLDSSIGFYALPEWSEEDCQGTLWVRAFAPDAVTARGMAPGPTRLHVAIGPVEAEGELQELVADGYLDVATLY